MTGQPLLQTAEAFRSAMRLVASSVTIVATAQSGERRGFTATAVCSLSLNPPALVVCANQQIEACGLIRHSGRFSVNVLSQAQENLARRFGGEGPRDEDRFTFGTWITGATGAPILLGSLASFDCTLMQALAFTTHDILIGQAVEVRLDDAAEPLLYQNRRYIRLN